MSVGHWNFIVERNDGGDVGQLLTDALVAGLDVRHSSRRTRDWSSVDGQAGLYRGIGDLTFSKKTRRWRIVARADCGATELASLVAWGLAVVRVYGSTPGHYTRRRQFEHHVLDSGERVATASCAIKLTGQDLQLERHQTVDVPDTVQELLSLTS